PLARLMENDFFGEMALVDRSQRSAQAAAVGHVILGRMTRPGCGISPARELTDFSRGKMQLTLAAVRIGELVQDLQADFAKCQSSTEVRIEILCDECINVDRQRLLRVFSNLIRNAREAMSASESKVLRFVVTRSGAQLRFEVSDTGCGIPAQLLSRIFEPFMTHGKANGTGLGLAIGKAVVEAHHGTIAVASSERGTTVTIDLPLET
ncbi:MAG: ATP-binding protein, partial [Verrucomicrobiota bacterium]|nr:ATP-binding protein [Verrucomicrobiota bacterium]